MVKIVKCKECGEYKEHKAFGLCVSCYRRDYYHKHREHEIKKASINQKNNRARYNILKRKYYHYFKDNGICVICGKNPINYNIGTTYCSECSLRHLYYNRVGYYRRKSLGKCQTCGSTHLYTQTRCYGCHMNTHKERWKYKMDRDELINASKYIENYLKEKNITLSNNVTKV